MTSAQPDVLGRARPRVFAGLAAGVPVVLLVIWSLGGLTPFDEGGLPVVPRLTLWSLPVDVFIRNVAAALTVGFSLVGGVLSSRPNAHLVRLASLSAIVWLAALISQVFLTVSEVLALPLSQSLDLAIVWSLLIQTTLGKVLLAQIVIVFFIAVLAWVVLGKVTGWVVFLAAATATWLPSFTGHSGISHGHNVATISLAFHMLSASIWVGGLAAIVVLLNRSTDQPTFKRFNLVAVICVVLLAESGLLNASLRLDGVASLLTNPYGTLLLAKVSVLIVLVAIGWQQRKRIAAQMAAQHERARPALLARLTALEFTWMGVVLGLSVALSRTSPPVPGVILDKPTIASLIVLAILIPLALSTAIPRSWLARLPKWLSKYPEVVAVAVLVSLTVAAQFGQVGYGNSPLGVEWQSLLVMVGLFLVGTAFALVIRLRPARLAIALVMLVLPGLTWWFAQSTFEVTDTFSWMVLGVTELALLWVFLQGMEPMSRKFAKRPNLRDIITLDFPLVIVLTLCVVATIIEFTRALQGISVAWVYTFQWPIIGVFAYVIWDRYRQGGRTLNFFQRMAKPGLRAKSKSKPPAYTPDEERAWLDYLTELKESEPANREVHSPPKPQP